MSHAWFSSIWIVLRGAWIFAAWKWGDWRHWRVYQSTILYMILCNLMYRFLMFNHPMWNYDLSPFSGFVLPDLLMMFIVYPCFVLLYLPYFPKTIGKQVGYIGAWFVPLAIMEGLFHRFKLLHYYNGWSFWWSLVFDISIFVMIRLHQSRPLLTYALSALWTVVLLLMFHVPVGIGCPTT